MGAAEGLHSSCCPPDPSCLLSVADAGPRLYEDVISSVAGLGAAGAAPKEPP